MYRKLLPLINRFISVRQGAFSKIYEGRLLAVEPEWIDVQTYDDEGFASEVWTITIATITEFSVDSRDLNALALQVKWALSHESGEAVETVESTSETNANFS